MTQLNGLSVPLHEALTRMQAIAEWKLPVVVVEEKATGKFVQFYGGKGKPIGIDVPSAPEGGNSAIDVGAAEELFGAGYQHEEIICYGKKCKDINEAVELAVSAFCLVHRLPTSAALVIDEHTQI